MKKWIFPLLLALLLLAGCNQQAGTENETTENAQNVETASNCFMDQSDFDFYVNISSENHWDLCTSMDTELCYITLSKTPLTSNQIPTLQFTGACTLEKEKITEEELTTFPFWLYQTYRGVDWNQVAALAQAAQGGDEQAAAKLAEYETLYLEDYEALTKEDLPQVYGYYVTNNVTNKLNPICKRCEQIPLYLDGTEYTLDVGCLDLHGQSIEQLYPLEGAEDKYSGRLDAVYLSYWGDGQVTQTIKVGAQGIAQTLVALELYGMEGEILDIQLSYGDDTQSWDGITPVEIPAATSATLTVTLQTRANTTVGYCEDANIALIRQVNDKVQRLWYLFSVSQSWNIYELYALAVDGLDIGAYYAYTAQWTQPEAPAQEERTTIEIEPVTLKTTSAYTLTLTGVSWDDFAYALHITAVNKTGTTQEADLHTLYLNHWACDSHVNMMLEPRQTQEFLWYIPWEAMATWGIDAQSGQDILSIETRDSDFSELFYATAYPLGQEADQAASVQGVLLLETDTFRIWAQSQGAYEYSALNTSTTLVSNYCIRLVMENLTDQELSLKCNQFTMGQTSLSGTFNGTLLGHTCAAKDVQLSSSSLDASDIEAAEAITFTVVAGVWSQETYTVTIDMSQIPKED